MTTNICKATREDAQKQTQRDKKWWCEGGGAFICLLIEVNKIWQSKRKLYYGTLFQITYVLMWQ